MKRAAVSSLALSLLAACAPAFDDRPYLITQPRLIAVMAEPPEARPGDSVELTAIVADSKRTAVELEGWFCHTPVAPADPRAASETCLDGEGSPLHFRDAKAVASIPTDACAQFGPTPARAEVRPADADLTGGYYQPFVIRGLDTLAMTRIRLRCPLPNLPTDLARTFEAEYAPNTNPTIASLDVLQGDSQLPESALVDGERVALRLDWSRSSSERYIEPAADNASLQPMTESLRVSWFTTSGVFATSTTGLTDDSTGSRNSFLPTDRAPYVDVWAVLQDDRGGSAAEHRRFRIVAP